MTTSRQLQSCTAIVTGASRGLGRTIAEVFWREGANLLLVARSSAKLEQVAQSLPPQTDQKVAQSLQPQTDQRVRIFATDLANADASAQIVTTARNNFNHLDILVNNAAIQEPIGLAWECDVIAWQRTLRVNLLAPVALCQAMLPWLAKSRRGKIINLSGGGATGPRPHFSAYATAKAGLVRFSETLAVEAQVLGVDVNCIAPGAMGTDMIKAVLAAGPEKAGAHEYEVAQKMLSHGGGVETRAVQLAVFLASAASDGITGRLISAVWDAWEKIPEQLEKVQQSDVFTLRRITPKERGFQGLGNNER
ncbi:MAG: SDR family NAD(P)-dependent oxidoreductase [Kiritimatiellaeota bacterium]|nr:SDR family NAD(P)-dependent oxidoreductase [Kiritimatiellota bacterium]